MTIAALLLTACVSAQTPDLPSAIPPGLRFERAVPEPPPDEDELEEGAIREFPPEFMPAAGGHVGSYSGVRKLAPNAYPDFADDLDPESLRLAAGQSDLYWQRFGDGATMMVGGKRYTVDQLRRSAHELLRLKLLGEQALKAGIASSFDVFESRAGRVVFTGYYEPRLSARETPDAVHSEPILMSPASGTRLSRARIRRGALAGRGLELAYTEAADLFNLQLQGSGWLDLGGGRSQRVHFSGTNEQPCRSVERRLLSQRRIPFGVTVWNYLKSLPLAQRLETLDFNPRYVFFRPIPPGDGPFGALGTSLTPLRSIAVSAQMPRGAPAFIDVRTPVVDESGGLGTTQARRFVFAQDAGKAISNPGRVDIFWGSNERAAAESSRMKEGGRLYFLILKS